MNCQVLLLDKPGNLEKVLEIISEEGANIVTVEHSRYDLSIPIRYARVDMVLETQSYEHQRRIIERLKKAKYSIQLFK